MNSHYILNCYTLEVKMTVLLRNVINEAVKIIHFISFQPLSAWFFKYQSLLMYTDLWCLDQEKALVPFLELQAELAAFLMEH